MNLQKDSPRQELSEPRQKSEFSVDDDLAKGPLHLSRRRHEIYLEEQQIILTPKEFDMLELLMQYSNELVSYQMMLAAFYPHRDRLETCDIKDNMRQRIHHLRRKLCSKSDLVHIQSIWGIGYKLLIPKCNHSRGIEMTTTFMRS